MTVTTKDLPKGGKSRTRKGRAPAKKIRPKGGNKRRPATKRKPK